MKIFVRFLLMVCFITITFSVPQAGAQSFFDFLTDRNIGKPAPDFTLKNLKGADVNMTKYRDGKKAIIFFWATWCPHCRAALKDLNQHRFDIAKKDIKLILVDLGEGAAEVTDHMKKHKLDMDVFLDTDNSLAEPYGIVGVPTFCFVNNKGIVQAVEHSLVKNYEEILSRSK